MMSFLKYGTQSLSQKNSSRICITLRQWSILFTILTFIIAAIVTTCATLGYSHAGETLDILKSDIHIEQEKHEEYGLKHASNNEQLLIKSKHSVITKKHILWILMYSGWILLVTSAILIYCTITKSPVLVLPCLLLSAWIYGYIFVCEMIFYSDYIKFIDKKYVVASFIVSAITMGMWYVICYYHIIINSRLHPVPKSKTVYTQEGFIHTVNPPKIPEHKKCLV